jgi:UDP-N-acetylmuramate dehydrogenase
MINEQTLSEKIGKKVTSQKDISPYITIRTRVLAEYFVEVDTKEELINAVKIANDLHIPFFFLGGGSNLAILKNIIPGLVIRNMYSKKQIILSDDDHADVLFSSGYPMSRVVTETVKDGLSGFEYHLGLPGTIGGAIYMNSKWTKPTSYIGDNLISAEIMDHAGTVRTVDRSYFQFAYDYSILQKTKEIFIEGTFRLRHEDPEVLRLRSQEALAYRKATQPFGVATAGCFFQNITPEEKERLGLETTSAGYLIDHAGLKGKQIGAYIVSDKHANFVINQGNGTPEDLQTLLKLIKSTVKEKYGVHLKEEVHLVTE